MMLLFLPYAAGLSLNQINPVVSRMLGSFLEEGSISVLNYANRIVQLPLGLFVVAVSQAVLPRLSQVCEPEEFTSTLGEALRFALFIVLPATVALIVISKPFVHLIFVRGAFGERAWGATSWALTLSVLGLPGMACSTIVTRGLYALSMPRAAFGTTLFSVGCTTVLSFILMLPMGYGGLALAPSVAFSFAGLLGLYCIRKKIKRPTGNGPASPGFFPLISVGWAMKIAAALALMFFALELYGFLLPYAPSEGLGVRTGWCLGAIAVGGGVYGTVSWILGFEEWLWIGDALARK
jgi:putative peptidoglycan lipid II flippase